MTSARAALAGLAAAVPLVAAAPAVAATFVPAGPEGGLVTLVRGGDTVLARGSADRLWRLEGSSWRACAPLPAASNRLARATVDDGGTIWAVSGDRLVRGAGGCATWSPTAAPRGVAAVAAAHGPTRALVVIRGRRAWRSMDAGRSWSSGGALPAAVRGVEDVDGDGGTLLVQNDGESTCSGDGGLTWRSIGGFSLSRRVVGTDGAIWQPRDDDGGLERVPACGGVGRPVSIPGFVEEAVSVLGTDARGNGLVDLGRGRLAFVDRTSLVAERGPTLRVSGLSAVEAPDGRTLVSTSSGVDAVEGGLVHAGDRGLRGTYGGVPAVLDGGRRLLVGGIFGGDDLASDDGGATWQAVAIDSPDGFDEAVALGRRSVALIGHGFEGEEPARVLLSADAGRTWERRPQGPWTSGDLLGDPAEEIGWAVHGGGVLRTRDGGRTWRRVSRIGGNGRAVARDGGLVVVTETARGVEVVRIGRDDRVHRRRTRGLPSCDVGDCTLALTRTGGLVTTVSGVVYRSRTGRRFSADARGLPRYPPFENGFTSTVLVDARTGRTVLGRVDGLFVQERPGRTWRRVAGAPREVAAVLAAGDRLLILSVDRGLESVDPAEL